MAAGGKKIWIYGVKIKRGGKLHNKREKSLRLMRC